MKIGNRKIFYGWIVVFSAFLAMLTVSIPVYSFGVFINPLTKTFGWSRANISGAMAIFQLLLGFIAVISGRLSDKYGVKRVMLLGLVVYSSSLILTSRISSLLTFYLCFAGLGIGASAFYAPLTSTISRWFAKRRGLAVGVAVTAFGVGMAVFSPLLEITISKLGWRLAFFYSGMLSVVLLSISIYLMKGPPEYIRSSNTQDESFSEDELEENKPRDLTVGEAMHSPAYWIMYFMLLLAGISGFFITVHIVPYAIDIGIPSFYAATLLTVIGLVNIGGRITGGITADKIGSSKALIALFFLQALVIFLLPLFTNLSVLYLIVVFFGLAYGGWAMIHALIPVEFFGTTYSGAILGTFETVAGLGGALGPYFAGYVYDVTGGYDLAFTIGGGMTVISALLAILLTIFFSKDRVNLPEWDL